MHPGSSAAHNSLGSYYYGIGDRETSKREFREAIKNDPEHKWAHYNLAKILIQERDVKEAERVLLQAAKLGPGTGGSNFVTIGTLFAEMGNDEMAEEYFKKAVDAAPDNAAALFEIGNYSLQRKEFVRAVDYFTRALKESDYSLKAGIYNSRGIASAALGSKDKAITNFHQAIKHNQTLEGPYLRLAEIYMDTDDAEAAVRILNQAIENAQPLSPQPFIYLIRILIEKEQFEEALEVANKWQTYSPNNPGMYLVRAQVLLANRDGNGAVMALRQALKLNPNFFPAYELLGDICFKARKPEEAKKFWEKTLELAPDNERVKEKLKQLEETYPGTVSEDEGTTLTERPE
jgi:tetratricopeptide (TPR) repeat protein